MKTAPYPDFGTFGVPSREEWNDHCKRCETYGLNPLPRGGFLEAVIALEVFEASNEVTWLPGRK